MQRVLFGSIYYNFADSEALKYTIKGGVVKTGTFPKAPGRYFGFRGVSNCVYGERSCISQWDEGRRVAEWDKCRPMRWSSKQITAIG